MTSGYQPPVTLTTDTQLVLPSTHTIHQYLLPLQRVNEEEEAQHRSTEVFICDDEE